MKNLSREGILRMMGMRDTAGFLNKINALFIDIYDEGGKLAEYSTQLIVTSKNITLLAQRVTNTETGIANLTVQYNQISATVTSINTTVGGHTTQIGQLQVTTQQLTASVSSVSDTVSGHTTQIGQLQITANSITQSVSSLTTTVNGHTSSISQLTITTNSISQDVSNISDEVDAVSGTVTTHTSQISTLRTDLNGISATVTADHTTLGTHTTQIGSLQVTTNSISGRVTAIEGDYVKEAEISLMVKKDGNGYISNASIKADNIDFTFTRSTNFISNGTTVMNINSSGDLWIKGNLKGGNIQGNYTVGTTGNRMEIYVDEVHQGYITTSGLRGYDSNGNILLDLRVLGTSVSDNSGYLYLYSSDGKYSILDTRSISFIPSNGGGALTFGYNGDGKVYIYAPISSWPSLSGSTLVGQVYLDNGYLRVRTS